MSSAARRSGLCLLVAACIAAPASVPAGAAAREAAKKYGPNQVVYLAALDFQPQSTGFDYEVNGYGGIRLTTNFGYFDARLDIPERAKLTTVIVYIDPQGLPTPARVHRFDPSNGTFVLLGNAMSSSGTGIEGVKLTVNKVITNTGTYRIDGLGLTANGAILVGAKAIYRPRIKK